MISGRWSYRSNTDSPTASPGSNPIRSSAWPCERIGFEPGEAVGESVFDLYDHRPEIIEHCERALDGKRVNATVEIGGRTFEAWYQPLREDGEVVGVVGHKYDVTEYR